MGCEIIASTAAGTTLRARRLCLPVRELCWPEPDEAERADRSCDRAPEVCGPNPGTSGLGIEEEIRLFDELGQLAVGEFYDLALDRAEIERGGLDSLDWSSDGCSTSTDSVGGTALLGPCARHDFSYRNEKAWEDFTGENVFSQDSRRRADDLLRQCINDVCGWECDFAAPIYWLAVNAWGDETVWPWVGWLPGV